MNIKMRPSLGKVKIFRRAKTIMGKEKEIPCIECDGTGLNLEKIEDKCDICKGTGKVKGKVANQE